LTTATATATTVAKETEKKRDSFKTNDNDKCLRFFFFYNTHVLHICADEKRIEPVELNHTGNI